MSGREEGEIIDPPAEGPVLRFIRLTPRAYAPEKMTEGSAGYDLKSPRTGAILPQKTNFTNRSKFRNSKRVCWKNIPRIRIG